MIIYCWAQSPAAPHQTIMVRVGEGGQRWVFKISLPYDQVYNRNGLKLDGKTESEVKGVLMSFENKN